MTVYSSSQGATGSGLVSQDVKELVSLGKVADTRCSAAVSEAVSWFCPFIISGSRKVKMN